jgi:hypothetical protein
MNVSDHAPTDVMCRRTPLPFKGIFLLSGRYLQIATNHSSILQAAAAAGCVSVTDTEDDLTPSIRWEIVGMPGHSLVPCRECDVTVGDHSLYLNLGPEQWFAFDLETYDGAGFVVLADTYPASAVNTQRYMASIASHVSASLRAGSERYL